MTERRETYQAGPQPELPNLTPWQADSRAFEAGFAAALRFMHRALFLRDWDVPMNAYHLAAKIRDACLAGELGGDE